MTEPFGSLAILALAETHGFAPPFRNGFAFFEAPREGGPHRYLHFNETLGHAPQLVKLAANLRRVFAGYYQVLQI